MQAQPHRDPYAQGLELAAQGRYGEAIECYEEALAARPSDIRVLFALGNTASALGMPKPAEAFFRQVLILEPARLEALVNLANLLRAQGQFSAAEVLLAPALAQNPQAPALWLTLGSVYRETGDTARAAHHYRQALAFDPDYPYALGNLADILADDGEFGEALALYDRALARDPGHAQARLNRAILHFLMGNLGRGWSDYEARLGIRGKTPQADRRIARWTGGSLNRTRLLVTAEQGVGDQIMFASLIPDLQARADAEGGTIILECDARLVPLIARSFPAATVRPAHFESKNGTAVAQHDRTKAGGDADAAIPLGSLAGLLRGDIASFPAPHAYLAADASETQHWRAFLEEADSGPFIGLCWRSGSTGGGRAVQYAPLAAWAEFLRRCPGTLVCAQYDATADERFELEKLSGRKLLAPPHLDQKNELDRTAALFAALDAVVSAPTAVSWLAPSLGVPTAKVLYDTSWTSFGRDREPFAPACQLIMPDRRGDWSDTFEKTVRWLNRQIARD